MEEIFKFHGIDDLYSDINGNFFYKEKPIKKCYRSGQIYIRFNKKKYGMITLRKLAYKAINAH